MQVLAEAPVVVPVGVVEAETATSTLAALVVTTAAAPVVTAVAALVVTAVVVLAVVIAVAEVQAAVTNLKVKPKFRT